MTPTPPPPADAVRDAPGPLDLLQFIDGAMSMPAWAWRERWPEWSALSDAAHARWDRETGNGARPNDCTDLMVNSPQEAAYHWCILPLIAAVIAKATEQQSTEAIA